MHDGVATVVHELLHCVDAIKFMDVFNPIYQELTESRTGNVDVVLSHRDHLMSGFVNFLPASLHASLIFEESGHRLSVGNKSLTESQKLFLEIFFTLFNHMTLF